MGRKLVSSGSPYESIIGFSRAVRVGQLVVVGGTAPIGPDGKTAAPGDVEGQARRCFEIVKAALAEAGVSFDDVVRTRTFLKHIEDWELVARVRAEYVGHARPVDTVMQVTTFINPEWLLEIEVDAFIDDED